MAKKTAKGKKAAKLRDLPPKSKGGNIVKGGIEFKLSEVYVDSIQGKGSPSRRPLQ